MSWVASHLAMRGVPLKAVQELLHSHGSSPATDVASPLPALATALAQAVLEGNELGPTGSPGGSQRSRRRAPGPRSRRRQAGRAARPGTLAGRLGCLGERRTMAANGAEIDQALIALVREGLA